MSRSKTTKDAINTRVKTALRKWRSCRGLTQAEAASLFHVPRRTYEKWEDPKRGIPLDALSQFCLLSDADARWLLLGRKDRQ